MSKLAELIQELCPNGVEYVSLGEVAHYARNRFGGGGRAKKKQGVIDKLKAFFEKYFGLGIYELQAEEQEQGQPVVYEIEPTYQMVAEEPAPYAKKQN